MQVINTPLVSNPWPSSRTKNKFNRPKPSKKMDPSDLHFYELASRIPQTYGLTLYWKGKKYMQVINTPLVSNAWPSSRTNTIFNRQKPSNKMDPLDLHFYELANRISKLMK